MVGIIIQARMGSSRLKGKTLRAIAGNPLLYYSVERAKKSKYIDKIIVATSDLPQDNPIIEWCQSNNVDVFRGNEQDVLDRYYQCATKYDLDIIIRLTADNPCVDPRVIDMLYLSFINNEYDYITMRHKTNTWPYGLDCEIFSLKALKQCWKESIQKNHREHVTMYIKDNEHQFNIFECSSTFDSSNIRITVDTQDDFDKMSIVLSDLIQKYGLDFTWKECIQHISKTLL